MSLLNAKLNSKDKKIHELDQKCQEIEKNYRKANKEVSDVLSARRKSDGLRDAQITTLEKELNRMKEEKIKIEEEAQQKYKDYEEENAKNLNNLE